MRVVSLLILLFLGFQSVAQNLLKNGDFEMFSNLPVTPAQLNFLNDWEDIVLNCDLMNDTGTFTGWAPQIGGAYSGSSYIGISTENNSDGDAEAVGQDIVLSPIRSKQVHHFGFYGKKASSGTFSQDCGGVELYGFSNAPNVGQLLTHVKDMPGAKLLWRSDPVTNTTWQYFEGCFQSNIQINHVVMTLEQSPNCAQYVYIDSVSLQNSDPGLSNGVRYETLCSKEERIDLNVSYPGATYLWSDNSTDSTFSITAPGTYWVHLNTPLCGIFTDTLVVNQTLIPLPGWGPDTALCPWGPLYIELNLPNSQYLWNDTLPSPSIVIEEPGLVWVTIRNGICAVNDTLNVYSDPCNIDIPNVFTPNGDKYNQTFEIRYLEVSEWNLAIYNRWGRLVYEQFNYDNTWEGDGLPDGMYLYELKNASEFAREAFKGWVQIVR